MNIASATARLSAWLARGAGWLLRVEDTLLVLLLLSMTTLSAGQILLRNVWDTGLAWGDPLLRVMVLWIGLIGAMVATRRHNHISIDVLTRYLPPAAKRVGLAITGLFTSLVCAVIAWHAARFVYMDWEAGVDAFGKIPAWTCELIIPIGFAVIAVRSALLAFSPPASDSEADK